VSDLPKKRQKVNFNRIRHGISGARFSEIPFIPPTWFPVHSERISFPLLQVPELDFLLDININRSSPNF